MLARLLSNVTAEHALLASFLSEVGTLAVLSAFRSENVTPSSELYYKLCQQYSKSLSIIVLKKWSVHNDYIEIVRDSGNWQRSPGHSLQLLDLVNLSLYHSIGRNNAAAELPALTSLAAYGKLGAPQNEVSTGGDLSLISEHWPEIEAIATALR